MDLAYDMVYNILAPKGTDPAIIEALSEACGKIINENEDYAKEIWDAYGASPFYKDTDEAIEALKADDELLYGLFRRVPEGPVISPETN